MGAKRERIETRELRLLLELLKRNGTALQEEEMRGWLTDIDWNQFVELVRHHRVFPTLYISLQSLSTPLIPADVLEALRQDYRRNTLTMLHLTAELRRICELLDHEGVRTLVLKGPLLAHELYGDTSLRTSKDLDLLIDVADIERAEAALLKHGYHIHNPKLRLLNDWKWKDHHQSYSHPHKQVQVELHWRMHPDSGSEASFEQLWEGRRVNRMTGYPIHGLSREQLLEYLISHGARHAWFRLRWLTDIACLLPQIDDYKLLLEQFRRNRSEHLGGQAALLVSSLLAAPVPYVFQPLYSSRKSRSLARQAMFFIRSRAELCPEPTPEFAGLYKRYLRALKTPSQQLAYLLRRLYPSSRDAAVLPLPRALHFLYVPLRPLLWCYRRVKQVQS